MNRKLDESVLDGLISRGVLTIGDREELENHKTYFQRNKCLLDLLCGRPYPSFMLFVDAFSASEPENLDVQYLVHQMRQQKQDSEIEFQETKFVSKVCKCFFYSFNV